MTCMRREDERRLAPRSLETAATTGLRVSPSAKMCCTGNCRSSAAWTEMDLYAELLPAGSHLLNTVSADMQRLRKRLEKKYASQLPPHSFTSIHSPLFNLRNQPSMKLRTAELRIQNSVLALQPPQFGTHYPLASAVLPLQTLSVVSLKLTASSRPTAPPSGSAKCLRFGHWLTLCTSNMHILTYLLTYFTAICQL